VCLHICQLVASSTINHITDSCTVRPLFVLLRSAEQLGDKINLSCASSVLEKKNGTFSEQWELILKDERVSLLSVIVGQPTLPNLEQPFLNIFLSLLLTSLKKKQNKKNHQNKLGRSMFNPPTGLKILAQKYLILKYRHLIVMQV